MTKTERNRLHELLIKRFAHETTHRGTLTAAELEECAQLLRPANVLALLNDAERFEDLMGMATYNPCTHVADEFERKRQRYFNLEVNVPAPAGDNFRAALDYQMGRS